MKLTNLDYVQSILSSLGSDEVNSVSDSTESLQVLDILKQSYFNLITRAGLPELHQIFQLEDSTDPLLPVLMYRPDSVKNIEWIKYYDTSDMTPQYKYVTILPNDQFLDYVNGYNPDETDVETFDFTVNGQTFHINYINDTTPSYCTVFSNYYIVFDSYDNTQDSTLQASKTQCYGMTEPTWENTDTFIPNLDTDQVPLLLSEAKSLAFFELKQTVHQKAELENKRQWSTLQKDKAVTNKPSAFDQFPSFGRTAGYSNDQSRFNRNPPFIW